MVPDTLYKYRAASRANDLRSRTIRLTPPGEFNDPFEALPAVAGQWTPETVEWLAEEAHRLAPEDGVPLGVDEATRELEDQNMMAARQGAEWVSRLANESFGVVSLSALPDSLLMWGHYADAHRGFVVGFDSGHAWFDAREYDEDPINHLVQVEYRLDRPQTFFADGTIPAPEGKSRLARGLFGTKSTDWSYEKEWRLICPLDVAPPDEAGLHLLSFPPELVTEVIFGWRMNYGDRAALAEVLEDPVYNHVRTRRSSLSRDRYEVVLTEG